MSVATVIITRARYNELSELVAARMFQSPQDTVVKAMARILDGVRQNKEVIIK